MGLTRAASAKTIREQYKPMKICIVSDSHDRAEPLKAAITAAQKEGAQTVFTVVT